MYVPVGHIPSLLVMTGAPEKEQFGVVSLQDKMPQLDFNNGAAPFTDNDIHAQIVRGHGHSMASGAVPVLLIMFLTRLSLAWPSDGCERQNVVWIIGREHDFQKLYIYTCGPILYVFVHTTSTSMLE